MTRRILLIGATGTFGSRLAEMLIQMPGVELILAARTASTLQALRQSLLARGGVTPISAHQFDRARPEAIVDISPWMVIDAAGPFQGSGYAVAAAAVGCGAHYIDLADGREYVAGFAAALHSIAERAGVLAVTAASSTPALSHAALSPLVAGWRRIDGVMVAISPGARSPQGLSVIEAILSYVGQPVRVFRQGRWRTDAGWSSTRRCHMPALGSRFLSLCETPDLDLLPERFPIEREALFMAGLEIAPMHLALTMLGWPVQWRVVKSLRPLARPLRVAAKLLATLGTDRGGMIVTARGLDAQGRANDARWALWADEGSGPSTPAAPAAALVRALLEGRVASRGAMPCVGILSLGHILRELEHLPIRTRTDDYRPDSPVMFERLLGSRWDTLPDSVVDVHSGEAHLARGDAIARVGQGYIARVLQLILGLPPSGRHDVEVHMARQSRGEQWTRNFGRTCFRSRLEDTSTPGLFDERIGPLRFRFDLRSARRGVIWDFVSWSCFRVKLPNRIAPRIRAGAVEANGNYRFRVAVGLPWGGLLFAYRGVLAASERTPSATSSRTTSSENVPL